MVGMFNWEIKISTMWILKDVETQYEFILLRSEAQEPFKIDSDIGGTSFTIGLLNDGTVVSENERLNGYAIIGNETIDLNENSAEPHIRDEEPHWVFIVTECHKAGWNHEETIKFCKQLDAGKFEVNQESILEFLRQIPNNPAVIRFR